VYNGTFISDPWKSKYVRTSYPWSTSAPLPAHKIVATREATVWPTGYRLMPPGSVKDFGLKSAGGSGPVDKRIVSNVRGRSGTIIAC